jgi:hypothetical protein
LVHGEFNVKDGVVQKRQVLKLANDDDEFDVLGDECSSISSNSDCEFVGKEFNKTVLRLSVGLYLE